MLFVLVLCIAMGIALGIFFLFHVTMVATNQTTNESNKQSDALYRYERQINMRKSTLKMLLEDEEDKLIEDTNNKESNKKEVSKKKTKGGKKKQNNKTDQEEVEKESINETRLEKIERIEHENLLGKRKYKIKQIKDMLKRTRSIGRRNERNVHINSVYDNTINAIKTRIEEKRNLRYILKTNEEDIKRNIIKKQKILQIENSLGEHLRKIKQNYIEKIKLSRTEHYNDVKKRIDETHRLLSKMEVTERNLLNKLRNTQSIEDSNLKLSLRSLNSIESKGCNKDHKKIYIKKRENIKSFMFNTLMKLKLNDNGSYIIN